MNIEDETLNNMGPGQGLVVRADDELEIHYSSPRVSPISGAQRRRWSTRAASLLDDQDDDEEDEDEAIVEPGLEVVTDDEETDSSDSSQSKGDDCDNERLIITFSKSSCKDEFDSPEDCVEAPQPLTLARLSDNISGMATYFCPSTFEMDADDIRLQTTNTLARKRGHIRHDSETDSFQKMVSYGPCGSNTIFNASIESLDRNSDHRSSQSAGSSPTPDSQVPTSPVPSQPVICSDLGMLDLRQHLISDISLILGSTTEATDNLMDTVQTWLTVAPSGVSGQKRVLNRCALRHGQSRRMKNLWNQWHFQTDTNGVEQHHEPQIARSFDDIDATSVRSAPPVEFVDLYYDSDPETFATTTRSRASRNHCADAIVTDASFESSVLTPPQAPTAARRTRGCSFDTRCSASKSFGTMPSMDAVEDEFQKFDLWDDQTVKDFVKELTVGNINLVWHTSANIKNLSNSSSSGKGSPVSVQGWFETGSRLQKALIHPKFMWRETYQPDIENRKLSMSCRAPASLDLFNIIRILKPSGIDRTDYPYAKLDHSFTIKNHDGEVYLFEAKSTRERDWFVHGLKLLVARLASMIIVGDDQMFLEFFSPWANSPVVEQFSHDGFNKGKEQENEEQNTSAKPFYVSTTNEDRRELWGTKDTLR